MVVVEVSYNFNKLFKKIFKINFNFKGNDNNFLNITQCERICGFMNSNTENLGILFFLLIWLIYQF